ncbi:MAG: pyridine nucleotide-disulfide oxidoreductase [Gemmatimonadetes bacterium SCN 70-22]|nr:MAG: pyridine nucleotide-disulfide oxidoreductase [Gemmatimonadetes bacterium SCN 70-22]
MTRDTSDSFRYRYLIVGGGMTADAAVRGIRELDADGPIGIIAAEDDLPYARPPLSKALWKGEPLESIWRGTDHVSGVRLHLGRRAAQLDLAGRRVADGHGDSYAYDKLLLATGGTPRRLPFGGDDIIYFRTLADYRHLRALAEPGRRVAVLGGGFIGSEVAAALALQGCQVVLLFPEDGVGARVFPADLARFLVDYYRERGVDAHPGQMVSAIHAQGAEREIVTAAGLRFTVDAVVAGLGIVPETTLAAAAGLTVNDGIVVDERLRSSHPDVWAAGDVARFAPRGGAGRGLRVEHEDNALAQGRAAGRAMAGDETPYTHVPFFYSDLFDLGYEAVGDLDARAPQVADWKEPFREGVVYYLDGDRVKGVLLWNVWGQVDAARELLAHSGPFTAESLRGRLPAP